LGRLDGRVAMVTGASRGIGEATARRFAREGARVCLTDVKLEGALSTARQLVNEGMDAFASRVDVTSRTEVENAVVEIVDRYGRLDILVNNAGVTRDDLLYKMTDEDWRTVLNVNLGGVFLCTRAAQRYMVERNYGRIVKARDGFRRFRRPARTEHSRRPRGMARGCCRGHPVLRLRGGRIRERPGTLRRRRAEGLGFYVQFIGFRANPHAVGGFAEP
jgi:NAD(P)-dependent dehydrogenase (short-subunit alcohol dehydrogenase family)